jgi:glycosyltransferase involved in cell wall biosynthesis
VSRTTRSAAVIATRIAIDGVAAPAARSHLPRLVPDDSARHDGGVPEPLRVAFTLEQCWHDVPGGTAIAALEVARRLATRTDEVELVAVAGRHARPPAAPYVPPMPVQMLPLARPYLYETWNRWDWPRVEAATGPIDVCHSTTSIPGATRFPSVVTVHDVAFVHAPDRFTRRGARVLTAGLERCRDADAVLVPSRSTRDDLVALDFDPDVIRVVPWGVVVGGVGPGDIDRVRRAHALPDRFVLFVGTIEPRKNLQRLARAVGRLADPIPLVVAGPIGWGDAPDLHPSTRLLGFVPAEDLAALYAAATVFAYPSLEEGFGMPVAEAMAQGAPVVTGAGTATEEVAGGAAVLVDPNDVGAIAAGIERAIAESVELSERGLRRAAELSWDATVDATVDAYRWVAGRRGSGAAG